MSFGTRPYFGFSAFHGSALFIALSVALSGVLAPASAQAKGGAPIGSHRESQNVSSQTVDLVEYLKAHIVEPIDPTTSTIPRYNRINQFGAWAHQDIANHCVDTRGEVLIRDADASVPLSYRSSADCVVLDGLWHDPYAGADMHASSEVQIDHVVPLKHAYYAGAYAWRNARRCHYCNFLANDFHLLAVSGHENMSKGDKGPDGYMPPLDAFKCEYISDWMKIKLIWQMTATSDEVAAIEDVIATQRCTRSVLEFSTRELAEQRAKADQPITACERFEQEGISAISPHYPPRSSPAQQNQN